jgi:hypothetical protein
MAGVGLLGGCQQEMAVQPSYAPLEPSEFFADGRSGRPLIDGTVARGHLQADIAFETGRRPEQVIERRREGAAKEGGPTAKPSGIAGEAGSKEEFVTDFPLPVSTAFIEHGFHRYMIYCVVCHDPLGTAQGKIVERGYTQPPSYHIERLREAPVGYLFAVASEGYGSMPSYSAEIPASDRWAITAYLRALQASQHFPIDKLPPDIRRQWQMRAKPDSGGGASP